MNNPMLPLAVAVMSAAADAQIPCPLVKDINTASQPFSSLLHNARPRPPLSSRSADMLKINNHWFFTKWTN